MTWDQRVSKANALMREAAELLDWNVYALGDKDAVRSFLMFEGTLQEVLAAARGDSLVYKLREKTNDPEAPRP